MSLKGRGTQTTTGLGGRKGKSEKAALGNRKIVGATATGDFEDRIKSQKGGGGYLVSLFESVIRSESSREAKLEDLQKGRCQLY